MAKVTGVSGESVLTGLIRPGDEIVRFNGRKFEDVLDYAYADSAETGIVTIVRAGKEFDVTYVKEDISDSLGLEFDDSVEINPMECRNNCIFCFVKQLPDGLRDTLYVKDDDYRLSFVSGSYITCTNLDEKDIRRIIEYKLTPLYVSVHATDEEVRKYVLGVKRSVPLMPLLKRFIDSGIAIHTQIVLVSGVNDGEILRKSLSELFDVGVKSVAVVPVGLTGHRDGLCAVRPLNREEASEAISVTEEFYARHLGFCYCADEMYQIAGKEIPESTYYGNYDQIENGVGLIAKFFEELEFALQNAPKRSGRRKIALITGVSGEPVMRRAKELMENRFEKIRINVYPVVNKFFGESVTVTGLVTAVDILRQYGAKGFDEDYIVMPSVMLKEFGDVFLDDVSVSELSKKLNKKIVVSHTDGESFVKAILRGEKKWQNPFWR